MSRKVTIPTEIADAIENVRGAGTCNDEIIRNCFGCYAGSSDSSRRILASWAYKNPSVLSLALVNGYERELTQEQRTHAEIREAYERWRGSDFSNGIMFALQKLDVKVAGVTE